VRRAKIQLRGQLTVDRSRPEPLTMQIVRQIQLAIEQGRLMPGTALPSTRAVARTLRVSRNTVLTAYDELKARGLARGRRGAAVHVATTVGVRGFDVRHVVREAQYPSRTITVRDPDGNPIRVAY
jgi:DNA-binding transcriptional MocR family regulator